MKTTSVIYIIPIISLCLSSVSIGVENPNVSTSFTANATVPSEGQGRRLLTSPNPLDAGSSNVVTGNVGGLRYFHGVVPYGSRYYSSTNLDDSGTGSVTSFLRRSTDPVLSDRNPGQTRAFYEPRNTVSSFYVQNGQRTALSESITSGQSQKSSYASPNLSQTILTENLQRPLSSSSEELDQILSRQFQLKEKAKESARQTLIESQSKFKNFFEIVLKPEEIEKPTLENPLLEEPLQEPEIEKEQESFKKSELEVIEESQKEQETILPEEITVRKDFLEEKSETEPTEGDSSDMDENDNSSQEINDRIDSHAKAEQIRGEHKTFATLSESKFSDYMRAAEEFMREGKFYKAADTYSLAGIWMSEDPRPYAGQSFALFAAGEYMSSAYYLSRAIEINPELATKKYDMATLIGDRDMFENRVIEMATWQQRSGSGELAFLMAYVLYHDGKVSKAAEMIGKAEEKMPDSAAVAILKDVIIPENGTHP
ncbi:MAG: hypothetical protein ISS71_10095 [Phycisphaerae bacterium]|nr:hypothetical protein [Phycisphaerae bacterium]